MRPCKSIASGLAFLAVAALPFAAPSAAQETVVPKRLSESMGGAPVAAAPMAVTLQAQVSTGAEPLDASLNWTVFKRSGDAVGEIVATHSGGALRAELTPGEYVAHIGFAGAATVKPFTVPADGDAARTFDLEFGAMRLRAKSGQRVLREGAIGFAIHDRDGRRQVIRDGIEPGETVVLPAGTYRAVVRYGDHNAVTGADIRVHPGEVTEAVLGVRGSPVTLALVRSPTADAAVATVTWRVFDSGGKPLLQTDEPTPALVLAPGNYTAEVLHGDWTTVHRFEVGTNAPLDVRVPLEG